MKFARRTRAEVEVNLTPLIDVVFLLLIFFMVSTTFNKNTELSIDLPEASGDPARVAEKVVEVTAMDAAGQLGFVHLSITTRDAGDGEG